MKFEEWVALEGAYLNDDDDAAKAARLMAGMAWSVGQREARDQMRAQAARDATEARWVMREQIAAWLESNGQPGYAMEIRCREWA